MEMAEFEHEFAEKVLYMPSELEKRMGVWVRHMGINLAKKSYQSGPKFLQSYSLHLLLEGKLRIQFHSLDQTLHAGDLFCMVPGVSYTYFIEPSTERLRMQWINFDGPLAQLFINQAGMTEERPIPVQKGTYLVRQLMADLMEHLRTNTGRSSLLTTSKFIAVIHSLYNEGNESRSTQSHSGDHALPPWLDASLTYMQTHFAEGITTEQIADWAGVTRAHFSKTFTHRIGENPGQYLLKLRMNEAASLLLHTSHTVQEIALSLGYSDPYSFTRAFTRWHGVSPRKFRG